MPLHLRKRGQIWHARGTVRVGTEVITVTGFSTGATARRDAEAILAREEARIRRDRQNGARGRPLTIDECLDAYVARPGGLKIGDRRRAREMSEFMGRRLVADVGAGWSDWLGRRGQGLAPSTVQRTRTALLAALAHGTGLLGGEPPPKLAAVRQRPDQRLPFLTDDERDRLLAAYNPHAGRVALVLAYQGLRTQEALRLDWRHVDLVARTIRVEPGKTGRGRTLPMHPHVHAMLAELRAQRQIGPVFLSSRGQPYADTRGRDGGEQGGNPLAKAHRTACAVARVVDFRIHDWRHDWATRLVRSGVPIMVLRELGGWSSMRMLERYVTIESGQLSEAIGRLS